jgi:hypothetical protein
MFPDKRTTGEIPGREQGESEMKDDKQEKKQKQEWHDPSFLLEDGARVI